MDPYEPPITVWQQPERKWGLLAFALIILLVIAIMLATQGRAPVSIVTLALGGPLAVAAGGLSLRGIFQTRAVDRYLADTQRLLSQHALQEPTDKLPGSEDDSGRFVKQDWAEPEARDTTAWPLREGETVAGFRKEQVDAVRSVLVLELDRMARQIRSDSIVITIAGFVAGGMVTFIVTLLVHPLP